MIDTLADVRERVFIEISVRALLFDLMLGLTWETTSRLIAEIVELDAERIVGVCMAVTVAEEIVFEALSYTMGSRPGTLPCTGIGAFGPGIGVDAFARFDGDIWPATMIALECSC